MRKLIDGPYPSYSEIRNKDQHRVELLDQNITRSEQSVGSGYRDGTDRVEKARSEQNTERIELAGSELNVANAQSFLKWLDRRGITLNMKILIRKQETKCQVSLQWGGPRNTE